MTDEQQTDEPQNAPTIDPRRCAVFAVHMQEDIAGAEGAFAGLFRAQVEERNVIPTVARLLDGARSAGAQVILARVAWAADYGDLDANSPLLQFVVQADCLHDGTPGAEIVPELTPREGDIVHTHKRMGGLTPELDQQLRERGIDTVALCGVATNASVEGTARQFSDAHYRVLVVEDACSAATPEAHAASIDSLRLVGEVTDTAAFVDALGAPAA